MKKLLLTFTALFAMQLTTAQITVGGGASYTIFEDSKGIGAYAHLQYNQFGLILNGTHDDVPSLGGKSYTNQLLGAAFSYTFHKDSFEFTPFVGINQHSNFSGNELDGMSSLNVDFESIETKKIKPQLGLRVSYKFFDLGFDPLNMTFSGGLRFTFGQGLAGFTKSGAHKYKGTRHSSKRD